MFVKHLKDFHCARQINYTCTLITPWCCYFTSELWSEPTSYNNVFACYYVLLYAFTCYYTSDMYYVFITYLHAVEHTYVQLFQTFIHCQLAVFFSYFISITIVFTLFLILIWIAKISSSFSLFRYLNYQTLLIKKNLY